jgi:hypothetical protein
MCYCTGEFKQMLAPSVIGLVLTLACVGEVIRARAATHDCVSERYALPTALARRRRCDWEAIFALATGVLAYSGGLVLAMLLKQVRARGAAAAPPTRKAYLHQLGSKSASVGGTWMSGASVGRGGSTHRSSRCLARWTPARTQLSVRSRPSSLCASGVWMYIFFISMCPCLNRTLAPLSASICKSHCRCMDPVEHLRSSTCRWCDDAPLLFKFATFATARDNAGRHFL